MPAQRWGHHTAYEESCAHRPCGKKRSVDHKKHDNRSGGVHRADYFTFRFASMDLTEHASQKPHAEEENLYPALSPIGIYIYIYMHIHACVFINQRGSRLSAGCVRETQGERQRDRERESLTRAPTSTSSLEAEVVDDGT